MKNKPQFRILFFYENRNMKFHANDSREQLRKTLEYLHERFVNHTKFIVYDSNRSYFNEYSSPPFNI